MSAPSTFPEDYDPTSPASLDDILSKLKDFEHLFSLWAADIGGKVSLRDAALLYALSGVKSLLGINTALLFLLVLRMYGVL